MQIRESAENYLEVILMLKKRIGKVRSIDVVNEMGFSKPSVSIAMKHFKENDLITVDDEGYIALTHSGLKIAENVLDRHETLSKMLMNLGVSEETAKEDACKMEHVLSEESYEKIKAHIAGLNEENYNILKSQMHKKLKEEKTV